MRKVKNKGRRPFLGRQKKRVERESEKKEKERKIFFFSLLSKINGNRTVGFHWSKRQSRSTHRELRVGAKILEFRQTLRGMEFSYLEYF